MFKTVIFDLDGTLLNTLDDLAYSCNRVCEAHGWPTFTLAEYRYFVGNGMPKLVERFSPADKRDPDTQAAVLQEFLAIYDRHKQDRTAPYAGVARLLETLREAGVQIGIFSNKDDGPAHAVVEHYLPGLAHFIRGRVEGFPTKPDPAGLVALMGDMQADPASTLFVGDSDVDILTGHNGRLPACGVLWGFRTREELQQAGADFLAADAAELERIILR